MTATTALTTMARAAGSVKAAATVNDLVDRVRRLEIVLSISGTVILLFVGAIWLNLPGK